MESSSNIPKFLAVKHPSLNLTIHSVFASGQELLNAVLQYEAKPVDIFVCTYQKCGTTWMQNIVWLITRYGDPIPAVKNFREVMPFFLLDSSKMSAMFDCEDFQPIIKTHLPYSFIPQNKEAKYIYVARNPKDAFVSYYFHIQGFQDIYNCPDLTFQALLELYLKGEVDNGHYIDHVAEWYQKRNESNVLFLLYEELKKDLKTNILKIARFLGHDYEERILKEDNMILKRIINLSSFKEMRRRTDIWSKNKRPYDLPFIRKGEIGDWKNHLTEEQSIIMDEWLKEKGASSGIDKLWKDHPEV